MDAEFDIVIVGGGIAGVSAAAALAGGARVALLEAEAQPGYHATGRSAAVLAQNYGTPLIRALTAASERDLVDPPAGFSDAPLLSPRGLVRIATPAQRERLETLYRDMAATTPLRWLDAREVEERVPLLRRGQVAAGFVNQAAADIDVHALLSGYLGAARAGGASLLTEAQVTALARRDGAWCVALRDGRQLTASVVVDAAGAWADAVAELAGAAPLGLVAMRRSAVTFAAPDGVEVASLPMVVDGDEMFYLKPEAGRLMASPGDETPAHAADARPEEIDIAICLDRVGRAFDVDDPRPLSTWAGLRTFAPDRAPVCGWDPQVPGFYWLAGQGGSGVQTAPALARIAADDLLGREGDDRMIVPGVARSDLVPDRRMREARTKSKQGEDRR